MRSTARGKIRQVIDRRKEATWWQRSAEQARAMSRVIETVEAAEEKLQARRRDGMNRLQAVRQLLEKERKRERVSTAVQVAKQEQLAQEQQAQRSTGEWVLDELGAETPEEQEEHEVPVSQRAEGGGKDIEDILPPTGREGSPTEGGGVSLAKKTPPRTVGWAEPVVQPARVRHSHAALGAEQRLEDLVARLIGEKTEDRAERIERLQQKVDTFLSHVQEWPTHIQAKPTRLMMTAENEMEGNSAVTINDILETRRVAQQPEEGVIAAREGHQNDDQLKRRCLFVNAPVRQKQLREESKLRWSRPLETLVDSGASRDFINEETVKRLGLITERAKQPLRVQVADGHSVKVDTVVHIDMKLDAELVYRTRAFVMPMGTSVDAILGMTFFDTVQTCQFDSVHKTLTITRNGRKVTLNGQGKEEARQRAAANALLTTNPGFLEVISPEEGAKDLRTLKRLARKAEQVWENAKGKVSATERREMILQLAETTEPMLLDMQLTSREDAESDAVLEVPEQGSGRYRAYVKGVYETLQENGKASVFHVDVSTPQPRVYLIRADERDELYPFGERRSAPKTPNASPVDIELITDPAQQTLVRDVLDGKLIPGEEVDVKKYGLETLTDTAERTQTTAQKLVDIFTEMQLKKATFGDEFWSEERRDQLTQQLSEEYQEVVRQELRVLDRVNESLEPAPIRLKEDWDGRAPYERCRRMSPQELEVLREQLAELLELGLIEPSASPFGAAVMIIPKPHQPNKFRMVIDYRRLNALTVPDKFPLPDIGEIIDDVGTQGHRYWASFDLCSGFYNIPVLPEHAERTAMSTPLGAYQWRVMPMGLKNAPSIFQRNMQRLFKDIPAVRIFVDDGVVGGATVEELYLNLRRVMDVLKEHRLIMKKSKLAFFKTSLSFLGHVISREGVSPQAEKVEAVRNWPLPTTKKDVRAFLGLCQFYSAFVYNSSYKMQPLIAMTKDDGVVPTTVEEWNAVPEALDAFNELKYSMCHAPVLVLPDYKAAMTGERPFRIQTDASEAAMGAVLMQDQGKGWQPVAFASKTFSPAEINYSVTEKELLALVWATTEKFRHYVLGTQYELQGDHKALITLLTPGRSVNRRQARWIEILQEQGVPQMNYVPGSTLVVPDALSRRPDYMQLIPTARQGLLANPRYQQRAAVPSQTDAEQEEYFTSKTRVHSMPARDTWMPAMLADVPKAPTLEPIRSRCTNLDNDPSLPTGVLPHGKVNSVAEDGGGDTIEHTHEHMDTEVDLCRTMLELLTGVWAAPLGMQPQLESMEHSVEAQCRDKQNWQVDPREFQRWHRFYNFTVDGCADKAGRNAQLKRFWSHCQSADWRGERVWCNPPFTADKGELQVTDILKKFRVARAEDPSTAACFILPYFPGADWEQELQNLEGAECVYTYPTGTRLFYAQDGGNPPTRWPVQVWWCPPLRESTASVMAAATTASQQPRRSRRLITPVPPPMGYDDRLRERRAGSREDGTDHAETTEAATVPRLVTFLDDLQAAQREDTECQKWSQLAREKATSEFRIAGNLLWRVSEGRYQLVLPADPPALRDRALLECHDAPMAGHWGRHKTLAILRQRFWWPKMADDVAEKCRTCTVCQRTKVSRQKPAAQLHQAELAIRRWQEINVDFVTGLALTERGYDAIMTVTDRKSKMVHLIPLRFKGSDSRRIARLFIDHVWRLHGMPMKLFTDRDPRFTAEFWKEVCRLTGMMSGMTTAYNPQANGGAERTNQTMEQVLRAYVTNLGTDWDLHLSAAEYAMNNSPASSTGVKPFVMMYGESPSTQLDLFVQQVLTQEGKTSGFSPLAKRFVQDWQRTFRNAQRLIVETQAREREQFQKKCSVPHAYKVGDQVMLSAKAITSPGDRGTKWKLRAQFYGPLTVIKTRMDAKGELTAYQLELPRQWKVHNWFAEDKLKPYLSPDTEKWPSSKSAEPPPTQLVDGREEVVVDRILGHRIERDRRGRPHMQWLISWKGYGAVHDEWKSVEDINTGGMELDAWREYEDMRRLKELAQPTEVGAHWIETLDSICAMRETVQTKVQQYLETEDECTTPWCHSHKPFRILVLFSGTGSVEQAVTAKFPHAVTVSVDMSPHFRPTHACTIRQWMEMAGGMESYPKGFFDIIWASPPCTEYSRAKTTGRPVPYCVNPAQPHRDLVAADDNVRAAREVINYLQPRYWFIENPVGYLATRPCMRDLEHLRHLCTYCRYGTRYRKATHIWTNAILKEPLKVCTTQDPCSEVIEFGRHVVTAQSGDSKTQKGSGSAEAVYPLPQKLVQHLIHDELLPRAWMGEVAMRAITHIWEGTPLGTRPYTGGLDDLQDLVLDREGG